MGQISPKFRLAFLLFNILYFAMGLGMLAVGIYNALSLLSFDVFSRPYYITGAILFIIVGTAKILLSIMALIGLGLRNKYMLGIYSVVYLFVILPTLTAGVFGLQQWYYVFNDVGIALNETYLNEAEFNRTRLLRESFRINFFCCGRNEGKNSDYTSFGRTAPTVANCTRAENFRTANVNIPPSPGCQFYITDAIRQHLYYIGAIGLAFGFFELTAAIVAMQNAEGL